MLAQLEAATRFEADDYVPVWYGPDRIGWVQPHFAAVLQGYPAAFAREKAGMRVISPAALDQAVHALAAAGWITGWRDERYAVASHAGGEGGDAQFTLERAAFRRFGLQARSAHLNGWVRSRAGLALWIARRSPAKQIDPNLLDNVVAGGIPAGSSPLPTLLRECGEEADIPESMARNAVAAGSFRVLRAVEDGVNHEVIHVFDLELPAEFEPVNRDGEVAQFMLMSADEAAARIEADQFTVDAGAVTIDFLWRYGVLRDASIGTALASLRGPRSA